MLQSKSLRLGPTSDAIRCTELFVFHNRRYRETWRCSEEDISCLKDRAKGQYFLFETNDVIKA